MLHFPILWLQEIQVSLARNIEKKINRIPPGQVFSARTINAEEAPCVRTIFSRLEDKGSIKRLEGAQGLYYVPTEGILGPRKPSRGSIIKALLTDKKSGYRTGLSLYNLLGLTTQVPGNVTIASNRAPRKVKVGNLDVEYRKARAPVTKSNTKLLQYLDVLQDIKLIPDTNPSEVVSSMNKRIGKLEPKELQAMLKLSRYYSKRVQALLGAILENNGNSDLSAKLKDVLKTGSVFNIKFNDSALPTKNNWNIK